jgi:hypothetical protein
MKLPRNIKIAAPHFGVQTLRRGSRYLVVGRQATVKRDLFTPPLFGVAEVA